MQSTLFSGDALLQQIADNTGGARISTTQNARAPAVKKVQDALLMWDPACLPRFNADGVYGAETAAAVHRFKTDVLHATPPVIDDVGPQTVGRLDRLAFDNETTPFTVTSVRLFQSDFVTELDPNEHVVGLNVLNNVVAEVRGTGFRRTTPAAVTLAVSSASPNGTGHAASVPPKSFSVPAINTPADTLAPVESTYQIVIPLSALEPFAAPAVRTIATVARQDEPAFPGDPHSKGAATSDAAFRAAVGPFIGRGFARQTRAQRVGSNPLPPDGDLAAARPDSLLLIQSAGVELLSFRCAPAAATVLLRRPADLVYYTGHGLSGGSNCLGIAQGPADTNYTCWATPADLVPNWGGTIATRVFVIAGCSLLRIDTAATPPADVGMAWVQLLRFKGGPLDALLGYRGLAPSDAAGGADIAREFAAKLAAGVNPVVAWLDVNEGRHAWNAAALSGTGQYTVFDSGLLHGRVVFTIP